MSSFKINLANVRKDPENYANSIEIKYLEALLLKARDSYFNSDKSIITDYEYDTLMEVLEKRSPDSKIINDIGYETSSDDKVTLPIPMFSMNKKKTRDSIQNWLKDYQGEYVVSDKLDGTSALVIYQDGKISIYTRGNGLVGRNISHLAKYMNLPKLNKDMILRGELIVSKENYIKYSDKYASCRAMVNGLVGTKTPDPELTKNLDFVGFELIKPVSTPYNQLEIMSKFGFKIPTYQKVTLDQLNKWGPYDEKSKTQTEGSFILDLLIKFKKNANYDIDGIIITHNKIHIRNRTGNPKHSFAFKANGLGQVTTVKNVEWNVSKHGYLIPIIEVEPVHLGSVIKHATGFNGKYIQDNKIGPGTKVRILLSGDVIPFVAEIVESTQAQMPTTEYIWNKTKVNIMLKNEEDDEELSKKKILSFFRTLKVENLSVGLINRLIDNGYDSIAKIMEITKEQLLDLDGIKETMSNKIYNNIHKIIDNPIELPVLMTASLVFKHGFGKRRFAAILKKYPQILSQQVSTDMISDIDGFSDITASQFVENLNDFKKFLEMHPQLKYSLPEMDSDAPKTGIFAEKLFVMTGTRDSDVITTINNNGGEIKDKIRKDIYMLITKDSNSNSSKVKAAELLGIKILSVDQFKAQYI